LEQLKWSEWCSLETLDFSAVPLSEGVYQVRWAIHGKPKIIHRANGDDKLGILYIGEGSNLQKRIKNLWRGIYYGHGHTAGWTYDWHGLKEKFKPEHLEVRWAESPLCDAEEEKLLIEYVEKYFDKPPLNMRIPRH